MVFALLQKEDLKICESCRRALSLKAYRKSSENEDGLEPRCKLCNSFLGVVFRKAEKRKCEEIAESRKRILDDIVRGLGIAERNFNEALSRDHIDAHIYAINAESSLLNSYIKLTKKELGYEVKGE